MKKNIKVLCFDLDGVICKTKGNKYLKSVPIKKNIDFVNFLFKKGYTIKVYTARGMGRSDDNFNLAKKKYYKLTTRQLNSWGVSFHKLILGKVSYDLVIDDKSIFFKKNWKNILLKRVGLNARS